MNWFTTSGGSPPYFILMETCAMLNEKPLIELAFMLFVLAVLFVAVRDCGAVGRGLHGAVGR